MLDKRIFALLPLLFILGCTNISLPFGSTSGFSSSPGVFIEEFTSDQTTISPEETTEINLKIANGGQFLATDIQATLFGLGELKPLEEVDKALGHLDPADPATGTPADKREASWLVQSPAEIRGTTGYKLGVRIDYMYGSDGWAEMLVTEKAEELIKDQEGQTVSTSSGITQAPVETQVYAPKTLLYREIDNQVNARVDLVNSQGGTLFCNEDYIDPEHPGTGPKKIDYACEIKMIIPSSYLSTEGIGTKFDNDQYWCCKQECDPNNEPDKEYIWQYSIDEDKQEITLTKSYADPETKESLLLRGRGKYRSHVCWFQPNKDMIGPEEKIPISATSIYGYSTKSELLLAVHGKEIEAIR